MRIAVTGGPGQLVLSMLERGPGCGHEVIAVGPPALDLAAPDDVAILAALAEARPEAIVNAAAHTAVDKAESEHALAFAINGAGAGAVARAALRLGVPLVQISTDYVFAGDQPAPYTEDDQTGPTGVYGASKLAGEEAVLASGADAAILRTAWVYSPFGANFVKTMLRLAAGRDELGVVADQCGNPTSALDLAEAAMRVAANLGARPDAGLRGVFHATGSGEASWADFAEEIFAAARAHGGPSARVRRITTAEYPTPARRPANSRLDCGKLAARHGVRFPDWRASTAAVVARLVREAQEGAGAA
ncbi:MAG: dTDP-4-dehydrorhamnose reductase [Sphingomonadales bacterium]|nr:dTDP-4-dehydrorhamnose reductase [Sphingomonadales bacterium]